MAVAEGGNRYGWEERTKQKCRYLLPHIPFRTEVRHQVILGTYSVRGQTADTIRTSADVVQMGRGNPSAVAANTTSIARSIILEARRRCKIQCVVSARLAQCVSATWLIFYSMPMESI